MKRLMRAVVAFSLAFAALSVGSAAAPQADEARSEHQKTVEFWTADKVRQAVPRDFVFDLARGRFVPAAPGGNPGPPGGGGNGGGGNGGGGAGGGDETTTTGAHWTSGGTVVDSTGKVLFVLGGIPYVCSASVVADGVGGRSLAVTAAHCVYENEGAGEFASYWMYIPEYEAVDKNLHILNDNEQVCILAPHGCWTSNTLVLHDGFASAGGFNGTAIQYDFAFAVLDENLEGVGAQSIAFDAVSKGASTYSFGYPHDSATFNHDLTYCAGGLNFDNRFFKLTYKLKCDMTGGASGGPWFFPFSDGDGTVMSVNSYRYSGGDALYGPKFNANTQAVYEAAKTTTASCIEPYPGAVGWPARYANSATVPYAKRLCPG